MSQNDKGFSLLETIFSLSLFLLIMLYFIPASITIRVEEAILETRREMLNELDNYLQEALTNTDSIHPMVEQKIKQTPAIFTFSYEDEYLKGCVEWTNLRNEKEVKCLYGHSF